MFGFEARDHVALGEALGILDFETASEVRMCVEGVSRGGATGVWGVCLGVCKGQGCGECVFEVRGTAVLGIVLWEGGGQA